MALNISQGATNAVDNTVQRTQMGTVGGDHIQLGGLDSGHMTSVVDSADARVGFTAATLAAGLVAPYNSTMTTLPLDGVAALTFTGTKIGVMAALASNAATIRVIVDGKYWYGIAGGTGTLSVSGSYPPVSATDTTINLSSALGFPASNGLIRIGSEYIQYTTFTAGGGGGTFSGCTRGALGTEPQAHYQNETVYQMGYEIDTSTTTGNAHRQLIWYADDLPSGAHLIQVQVSSAGAGGGTNFYFDGFVTGPLLGASNIYTQLEEVSFTFTTDSTGHNDIGPISVDRGDVALISIMGYTQTNCEGSNTNTMGKLGMRWAAQGSNDSFAPYLYYHNGPASTSITVTVTFGYIGESVS